MEKQIIMLHKGWVHLFWTGGQSAALCQQPKPTHNSPKDDYANASQPSYFPRNRRRAPSRSYNCFAVMWKNKQFFLAGGRVFSLRALLQYVWDIQTHTHTHTCHEKTQRDPKCILLSEKSWSKKATCCMCDMRELWGMCLRCTYRSNTRHSLFHLFPKLPLANQLCLGYQYQVSSVAYTFPCQ